ARAAGAGRGDGVRGRPGLVVLAPRDGLDAYAPDPGAAEGFVGAGTPHLYGGVVESTGFVGPLVTPGISPCAGCILRSRAEREPSWPLVVGQWRTSARRRSGVAACDSALATVVAGAIASYALSFLDGDGACAAGYRTRFALPHLMGSTEQFSAHRECPCGAASVTADRPPSADAAEEVTMA
ncbi:thiamine biosynthesis protein ThiF, partial [Streptomyces nanshensis]